MIATKRELILVLRCVCRTYHVLSVARLRRTLRGTTWLPRVVAGTVLACLRVPEAEIAPILRVHLAEVFDHQRLLAVMVADNNGILAEVRDTFFAAQDVLERRGEWMTF